MSEKLSPTSFKTTVVCPQCQTKGVFEANQLIDTLRDPNALEKVLTAQWFDYVCPACGEVQTILYTCLFHDAVKKMLYAYADNEKDYARLQAILSGQEKEDEMVSALENWIDVCDCRVTNDFSSFQEKLLLSYLGLDDRAIEICKYMTEVVLEQEGLVDHIDAMYFNTEDDEWIFMIDTGEERFATSKLKKEMYEDVLNNLVLKMEKDEKPVVIDREWVKQKYSNIN